MFSEQRALANGTVDFSSLSMAVHDFVKDELAAAGPSDQENLLPLWNVGVALLVCFYHLRSHDELFLQAINAMRDDDRMPSRCVSLVLLFKWCSTQLLNSKYK